MSGTSRQQLLVDLESPDPAVRAAACRALDAGQAAAALDALIEAREDDDASVAAEAAATLGRASDVALEQLRESLAPTGVFASVLNQVLKWIRGGDGSIPGALLSTEWRVDNQAAATFVAVLEHAEPRARRTAVKVLGKTTDSRALRALVRVAGDTDPVMRSAAAEALARIDGPESAAALMTLARDAVAGVQTGALEALGRRHFATALPLLVDVFCNDPDQRVRNVAANWLGERGDLSLPHLATILQTAPAEPLRREALRIATYAKIGDPRPVLVIALSDAAPAVRLEAIRACKWKGNDEIVAGLALRLEDESLEVGLAAVDALGTIASSSAGSAEEARDSLVRNAVRALVRASSSPMPELRLAAVERLAKLSPPNDEAIAALVERLSDEVEKICLAAAAGVPGGFADDRVTAVLFEPIGRAGHPGVETARRALARLVVQNSELGRSARMLLRYALTKGTLELRCSAAIIFGLSGDRTLVDDLVAATRDEEVAVRRAAWEALKKLKGLVKDDDLRSSRSLKMSGEEYRPPPEPPGVDQIAFSVVCPATLATGEATVLSVWAHLAEFAENAMNAAQRAFGTRELLMHTKTGIQVQRGAQLTVRLKLPGFAVDDPEDSFVWSGSIVNASFPVRAPNPCESATYPGMATVHCAALQIAKLHFVVAIGKETQPPVALPVKEERLKSAFASYASKDRNRVLARIQGMQKITPLDVFLDVLTLRSGEQWQERIAEEIRRRDVFYLFWSEAAKESEWVEREWRTALDMKGVDFIDPVPLEPPDVVAPPAELAGRLHFNDWVFGFLRGG